MPDSTYNTNATATLPQTGEEGGQRQSEATRAHEKGSMVTVRAIVTVVAILLGILLVLFIVAWAARYDSIFTMLGDMGAALGEVFSRIFS